jgi:hypothetical protein
MRVSVGQLPPPRRLPLPLRLPVVAHGLVKARARPLSLLRHCRKEGPKLSPVVFGTALVSYLLQSFTRTSCPSLLHLASTKRHSR